MSADFCCSCSPTSSPIRLCKSLTRGTKAERKTKSISKKKIGNRSAGISSRVVTSQLSNLGRLKVHLKWSSSKSVEAGGISLEKLLKNFAPFLNNDLGKRVRAMLRARKHKDPNRLQAIGPNLGDYT